MNFTKHEELHEKRSEDFIKHEVEVPKNPVVPRVEGLSKDIIKYNQEEEESEGPRTALEAYTFSFRKNMYTGHIQGYVSELFKRGFTDAFVREIFMEMGERGIGADVTYMRKLSEDWISKGVYTRAEAKRRKEESNGGKPRGHKEQVARHDVSGVDWAKAAGFGELME
jgi:hypothetical protein